MVTRSFTTTTCLALLVGLLLLSVAACSKKSVQSGAGDKSSEGALAQSGTGGPGGMGSSSGSGGGSSFPDLTLSNQGSGESRGGSGSGSGGGLKGFEPIGAGKSPSEERLAGGGMLAKAEPSDSAGRQLDEIRREQEAAVAAGLRDVFFAYDSWTLTEEGRQALGRDAEWIKTNSNAQLKIEGHCDERGTLAYNLVLGEKRAKTVRNYLVELGVNANRLIVVSYGKERPFCKEHAESCYQQNRRGHIVLRTK